MFQKFAIGFFKIRKQVMLLIAFQAISVILEKFKEKKPNVVAGLREAIDASYQSVSDLPYLFYSSVIFSLSPVWASMLGCSGLFLYVCVDVVSFLYFDYADMLGVYDK